MSSCKSQDVSYGEGEDRNNNDVDLLKALGGEQQLITYLTGIDVARNTTAFKLE